MSEEKLDPCTASAKLLARRTLGHGKRGGDAGLGPMLGKTSSCLSPSQGWGGWASVEREAGQDGEPVARTAGRYCSWLVWQLLVSQPGEKGVLESQGQSQLPELVLLDVLVAPSIRAHLGGAACLRLVQAGLQTMHTAQGHADLVLHTSLPCCHACTLCVCCASAFFLCSCWVTPGAAGSTQCDGIRCSPSSHLRTGDTVVCTGMDGPRSMGLICCTGKKNPNPKSAETVALLTVVLLC